MDRSDIDKKIITPIFFTILVVLPILAPIFAALKLNSIAEAIYLFFQFFCHQRPWRSIHLFDYQIAVCTRDLFMYFGLAISTWFIYFNRNKVYLKDRYAFLIIFVSLIPMALDGGVQLVKELNPNNILTMISETTNLAREVTGFLSGLGVGIGAGSILLGKVNEIYIEKRVAINNLLCIVIQSLLIGIILIPITTATWYLTSMKYRPSSILVDTIPNYPGYNYEVTTNLGHGIGKRLLIEPINDYCLRAKLYDPQEFQNKCAGN